MWRLVDSDIWRDGGSFSLVLSGCDQTVGLWLNVKPWDRLEDIDYDALYVSRGSDPTLKERLLSRAEEASWLLVLERQLNTADASDYARARLQRLLAIMRRRALNEFA